MFAQSFRIKTIPSQLIIDDTFELYSQKLDTLKDNEIMVKTLMLSVDPSNRIGIAGMTPGSIMSSSGIAQVIDTKSNIYNIGDIVLGTMNWSTHSIINALNCVKVPYSKYNQKNNIKLSYYLGVMGAIGVTSYMGLLDIGKVKNGESVFITGAAGATGSIAAQIAKNVKNCYVVGTAGTNDKCNWLKNEIGLDNALNYKNYTKYNIEKQIELFRKDLSLQFPNGIDVYFDNTGGFQTEAVWDLLNNSARVVLCGQISQYNNSYKMGKLDKINNFLMQCILKNIRVEGFLITEFKKWDKFHQNMKKWIIDGKVKCAETIINGFNNIPLALKGLFIGKNTGKMIVNISDVDTSIMNSDSIADKGYPDLGYLIDVFIKNTKDQYFKSMTKTKSKL